MSETWTLRVEGDDATRTARVYDQHGYLVEERPYSEAENAKADQRAQRDAAIENASNTSSKLVTVDFPAMQGITDQTPRQLGEDPGHEIKSLARAVRRLIRRVENLTDGSD